MNVLSPYKKRSKDYQKGYNQGFQVGVKAATKIMSFQIIQYLGDKRGWCRDSIFRALLWLHKHAECLLEDLTTFDEVVEAVKEEYGIVFDGEKFGLLSEETWKKVQR